jgi:hypothetical protein
MNPKFLIFAASVCVATAAMAQASMYKCPGEYTNTITEAEARTRKCTLFSGGNVTVVQSQKAAPRTSSPAQRVDAGDQRAKDSDARLILEAELKKAEARQVDLLKEFNNGEPERLGPEGRNFQKYQDRIAELKASISRNESDIAGIRRELGRVPAASASSSPK